MDTKESIHATHEAFRDFAKDMGDKLSRFLAMTELAMVRHVAAAREAGYAEGFKTGLEKALEIAKRNAA